jgi:hypothetical protein
MRLKPVRHKVKRSLVLYHQPPHNLSHEVMDAYINMLTAVRFFFRFCIDLSFSFCKSNSLSIIFFFVFVSSFFFFFFFFFAFKKKKKKKIVRDGHLRILDSISHKYNIPLPILLFSFSFSIL